MALNTCEMWSNWIKIAFYFKKLQKNRQGSGGLNPKPLKPPMAGGFFPAQTPVCNMFELH